MFSLPLGPAEFSRLTSKDPEQETARQIQQRLGKGQGYRYPRKLMRWMATRTQKGPTTREPFQDRQALSGLKRNFIIVVKGRLHSDARN